MADQTSTIPNGWRITTFGAEASIKGRIGWRGYTIEDLRDTGTLVIGGTQIKDNKLNFSNPVYISEEKYEESPEIKVILHDIILTKTGTVGGVAIVNKDIGKATINPNVALIRATRSDPYYLYYLLLSREAQHYITSGSTASVQPAVNQDTLRKFEFYCPDKNEQQAIAAVLSSLDNKIELLREQNKTLEATAQALFKEWFVNFNFPGSTSKMVDSELGEIPEGWTVCEISDLFEVKDGTHDSPKQSQEGHYLITSRHLNKGGLDFNNAYFISDKDFVSINKRSKVESCDILISMIGTVGLLYFVLDKNIDFAIKNVGLFKTSQKKEMAEYVYLFLNSKEGLQYIQSSIAGTTQSYVSLTALRNIPIIVPQSDVINIFNKLTQPIFSKIFNNISQIQTLTKTRDTLLPKMMKGELRVKGFNN